jgi:peptidoglycan/xylan/chitin deacetylase (PgdA/CDA1 family)
LNCTVPGTYAVTFDDGPWIYTENLREYLITQQVKATFFINGDNWANLWDPYWGALLRRMVADGHQIASHTYDHPNLNATDSYRVYAELLLLEDAVRSNLGFAPRYMRPPFGLTNSETLQILGNLGYKVVIWNIDSNDWLYDNPTQQMAEIAPIVNAANSTRDSFILLDHDTKTTTEQWVEMLIPYLKSKGYDLVTVAECLGDTAPYKP